MSLENTGSPSENENEFDLLQFISKNNHDEIKKMLRQKELSLGDIWRGNSNKDHRTVFYTIMTKCKNGNKLVKQHLDAHVETLQEDKNVFEVRLELLRRSDDSELDNSHATIVRDIVELLRKERIPDVMMHPLIELYLLSKWNWILKYFGYFILFIHFLFCVSYTAYAGNLFYWPDGFDPMDMNNPEVLRNQCYLSSRPPKKCKVYEGLLILSIILLLIHELFQMIAHQREYWFRVENYLAIVSLGLAIPSLVQGMDIHTVKRLIAIGLTLAWIHIFVILGRNPPLVGEKDLSLLFYSIIRQILPVLLNFSFVVIAFAYGFFVIHYGTEADTFRKAVTTIFKTLTMILGEYEFDSLNNRFVNQTDRFICLTLLVGVAVVGTLIIINLIVALIVTDLEELKIKSKRQALENRAYQIFTMEGAVMWLRTIFYRKPPSTTDLSRKLVHVCAHDVCKCADDRKQPKQLVKSLMRVMNEKMSQDKKTF